MSDTEANWMVLAKIASQQLSGVERGERTAVLARVAEKTDQSVNTVRRAMAASDYARGLAEQYGVSPEFIIAPMSTIETLKRITKIAPEVAGVHLRGALLGQISYGSLLALCKTLELQARDEAATRKKIDTRTLINLIKADLGKAKSYRETNERSIFARTLRVDLELTDGSKESCNNIVAVMSPQLKSSVSRITMNEICVAVLTASLIFEKTYYIAENITDREQLLLTVSATRINKDRFKTLVIEK